MTQRARLLSSCIRDLGAGLKVGTLWFFNPIGSFIYDSRPLTWAGAQCSQEHRANLQSHLLLCVCVWGGASDDLIVRVRGDLATVI